MTRNANIAQHRRTTHATRKRGSVGAIADGVVLASRGRRGPGLAFLRFLRGFMPATFRSAIVSGSFSSWSRRIPVWSRSSKPVDEDGISDRVDQGGLGDDPAPQVERGLVEVDALNVRRA